MEVEGVHDQQQQQAPPSRGDGGSTDAIDQASSTGAAENEETSATNPKATSSSQQADADADAEGNEIKYESDGDDALLRREERRISRLEAQEKEAQEKEAQQEEQDGDGEEGNNNGQNDNDDAGDANPDQDDDDLDEDEEAYAAILDPLHGYECPEPDYATADALPFPTLVKRFETLWAQKKRMGNKQRREQLLEYLLPRKLLDEHLKECSIYPLLRLILPDCDVARGHLGMKEKSIANAWAAAMGFSKESKPYKKLVKFMDPQYAGHTATGDLSLCVKEVVAERYPMSGSKLTVGQMNRLLDELQMINSGKSRGSGGGSGGGGDAAEGSAAHAWRTAGEDGTAESAQAPGQGRQDQAAARKAEKQRQKKTKAQRQAGWVEKLMKCNMSVS